MESPLLFFSPTVNYAGQAQFAPGRRFTDKATGVAHTGRTALAVTVEPGSYKVGTATAGANRWLNMFYFNICLPYLLKAIPNLFFCHKSE